MRVRLCAPPREGSGSGKGKVVEFDVLERQLQEPGAEGEREIEYAPRKIDLGGQPYPLYMKENISFEPSQAPLFFKNMLAVVFENPTADASK